MTISWYPGHMHKAKKELIKLMANIQVVVELLDARLPLASSNPLLNSIRGNTPCIKVLNKADLAIASITASWQSFFNSQPNTICLLNGNEELLNAELVLRAAKKLMASSKGPRPSAKQLVIVGIPNVGKSTLLNRLVERKLAKTGNEPAVTKGQQRVKLEEGWYLIDTPGLLWPKLEDQTAAYRLALTGTIRNTAVEAEDIAWFAAELLIKNHREVLQTRYDLLETVNSAESLLHHIASKRGCLRKNGQPDWHKTAEVLLNDFRSGKLGRFSLESPPQ